jgi:ankyrin repeat protein
MAQSKELSCDVWAIICGRLDKASLSSFARVDKKHYAAFLQYLANSEYLNIAVQYYCKLGYAVSLVVLLKKAGDRCNLAAGNNIAIRLASFYGRTEVVRLLLASGKVDPAADDNCAIRLASENGSTEVVELLKAHGCNL